MSHLQPCQEAELCSTLQVLPQGSISLTWSCETTRTAQEVAQAGLPAWGLCLWLGSNPNCLGCGDSSTNSSAQRGHTVPFLALPTRFARSQAEKDSVSAAWGSGVGRVIVSVTQNLPPKSVLGVFASSSC